MNYLNIQMNYLNIQMKYLNIQMNYLNIQMNDLNIQMPLFVIYKIIMSRLECSLKINRFKIGRAAP